RMPLLYERSYEQYRIEGRTQPVSVPMAEIQRRDSIRAEQEAQCRMRMEVRVGNPTPGGQAESPTKCGRGEVVLAGDTAALLNSPLLPANAYSGDEELLTEADLKQLRERLEDIGGIPDVAAQPEGQFMLLDLGMLRYNRIEGLSGGVSGRIG